MGYSLFITLLRDVNHWLIDVAYVVVMGNLCIICFFIVNFLVPYSVKLLKVLGFSG